MIRRISILILLLSPLLVMSQAAGTWNVHQIHEEDGLGNTLVKNVLVDSYGDAWIGTDDGVYVYNGFSMEHIKGTLPNNYIKDLEEVDGKIFISTDRGVASVQLNAQKSRNVELLFRAGILEGDELLWYPKHIFSDQQGTTWISDNNSLLQYGLNGIERYELKDVELPGSFSRSTQVFTIGEELCALSQKGQLYFFDDLNNEFDPVPFLEEINSVHAVKVIDDFILIASDTEVHLLKISGDGIELIESQEADISCFSMDENRVLAGTWNSGLLSLQIIEGNLVIHEELPLDAAINDIHKNEHQFWLGTDEGCYVITKNTFFRLSDTDNSRISPSHEELRWFDGNSIVHLENGVTRTLSIPNSIDVLFGKGFAIGIDENHVFSTINLQNGTTVKKGQLISNPQYACFDDQSIWCTYFFEN
ncbi:MAG: hypothetical protein HRT74_02990, partial [Flavobacteriales bacterium]|nr:hypothetical protein [Flavobacteriales bacterium]